MESRRAVGTGVDIVELRGYTEVWGRVKAPYRSLRYREGQRPEGSDGTGTLTALSEDQDGWRTSP